MADDEDVARMAGHELDMVATDLTGARFEGQNHSGADFGKSRLAGTIFEDCNLSGCNFLEASFNATRFIRCDLRDTRFNGAIFAVIFDNSDLRGARIRGLLHECSFANADLRGTTFRGSRLDDMGTDFSGAQHDDQTNFDDVQALRAYSRLPIFSNYDYGRGKFSRRSDLEPADISSALGSAASAPTEQAFDLYESATIDVMVEVAEDAARLLESLPDRPAHGAIGHNNPPQETPFEPEAKAELAAALRSIAAYAKGRERDVSAARSSLSTIKTGAVALKTYVAGKLDVAATSFAEKAGETMASGRFLLGAYVVVTGKIDQLLALAERFLSVLF